MKKIAIVIVFIASLAALVVGLWFWSSAGEIKGVSTVATPITTDNILFFGRECPHCKDVEKFIEENKIAEKVAFDSLEVWHNDANKEVFLEKIKECGIAEDKAGVPLLYAKGKCLIGTPNIEKFFRQEAGL